MIRIFHQKTIHYVWKFIIMLLPFKQEIIMGNVLQQYLIYMAYVCYIFFFFATIYSKTKNVGRVNWTWCAFIYLTFNLIKITA